MKTRSRKWFGVCFLAVAIVLSPILFTSIFVPVNAAYFDGGHCGCGNQIYIRLANDGYWTYSPGHEISEHRSFALRANTNGWDLIRVNDPQYDEVYLQMAPTGVVATVWIEKGQLCERWGSSPRILRFRRINNPWPIWWEKLLKQ